MNLKTSQDNGYEQKLAKGRVTSSSNNIHAPLNLDLKLLHNFLQESKPELQPTVEAISSWLNQIIPIKLVAYWNPRSGLRSLYCKSKDESCNDLLEKTQAIIDGPLPRIRHWRQQSWLFHLWTGEPLDKWDRILIVESGTGMTIDESNKLMEKTLKVIHEPLRYALKTDLESSSF
ncbi:MAG: hypothetical protein HQL70_02260 [Magnetococcales bacterium]|nr:hypothetical protein [Magnetococcales bacterium]